MVAQPNDYPSIPIGLWGASRSGKTTFLGALRIATLRGNQQWAEWRLIGANAESRDWLIDRTEELESRQFPSPTQLSEKIRCFFSGNLSRQMLAQMGPAGSAAYRVAFTLDVIDAPGLLHQTGHRLEPAEYDALIAHLMSCRGILFLYDLTQQDGFASIQRTLDRLAEQAIMAPEGTIEGGKLPHHIAVCITKFDDPRVFEEARRIAGIGRHQTVDAPMVKNARAFFEAKAPDLVRNSLRNYFSEKRINYFATSAIGFHTDEQGRVIEADYANARTGVNGAEIRSQVRPINVLEPLIWLEHEIRKASSLPPPLPFGYRSPPPYPR
jgi:hypothetical protein